jgi:hypothetical protein
MKTFVVNIYGRERGAIGIFYPIEWEVEAENEESARQMVYENDKYEPQYIRFIREK